MLILQSYITILTCSFIFHFEYCTEMRDEEKIVRENEDRTIGPDRVPKKDVLCFNYAPGTLREKMTY